jgi:heme/copper-type cytochrome/quinol oxidase subunit 1
VPKLSVWFVRASLVYMGIGFFFGAMLLHHKGIPIYPWTWQLLGPHMEIMIFGWTMQFVMGMAYWIVPRFTGEGRFGYTALGWWALALLNSGVALTAVGAWFSFGPLMLGGRFCTLAAVSLFVLLIWPRVKPLGGYAATHSS